MNDGIYDAWKADQRLAEDKEKIEKLSNTPDVKEYLKLRKSLNDYYGRDLYWM